MKMKDSTVYWFGAVVWLVALALLVVLRGFEGWWALVGTLAVVACLLCLVWAHRAYQHEAVMSMEAEKNRHPASKRGRIHKIRVD